MVPGRTMNLVPFGKQKAGQIGAVLAGNTENQSSSISGFYEETFLKQSARKALGFSRNHCAFPKSPFLFKVRCLILWDRQMLFRGADEEAIRHKTSGRDGKLAVASNNPGGGVTFSRGPAKSLLTNREIAGLSFFHS